MPPTSAPQSSQDAGLPFTSRGLPELVLLFDSRTRPEVEDATYDEIGSKKRFSHKDAG